ncbi:MULTISPECIES: TolB family protein [Croceitalea]|uniref:TolB family protein n=1 Tax=Croceitalea marina TaxID=1775166 RepID=A0ABW5MZR4_9FLAO
MMKIVDKKIFYKALVKFYILFLFLLVGACVPENKNTLYTLEQSPNHFPIDFKSELVPEGKIIHRGIFSPDLKEYYYTVSDTNFGNFQVYIIHSLNHGWSEPELAFFNSQYNEHGMSFSPDGNTLYFSSTRPIPMEGVSATWHLWKSEKLNGRWSEPVFVDIPNLRSKLVSHPTVTNSGTLYFHSSNLDYSEMSIYRSKKVKGVFQEAKQVSFFNNSEIPTCTPYVSPNEDYLIFALVGNQLDLMISHRDGQGHWSNPIKLDKKINTHGQGNPYVTPDNKFLFLATGKEGDSWKIQWVNIEGELENHSFQNGYNLP